MSQHNETSIDELNKHMQKKYPGNYYVEEYYDESGKKDVRLKFHSEKDETLFHLRWG